MGKRLADLNLTRAQKILLALYKLSGGSKKQIRFENIAVKVYKLFQADFQLRGYPQYPDTGDIVHKPLYSDLKKNGYVLSGDKYFSLTSKGIEYAKKLLNFAENNGQFILDSKHKDFIKLTATQEKEIQRIRESAAFELFSSGKKEEIIDIDFYAYLGVTVRSKKFDFLGRMTTVEDAIQATVNKSPALFKQLSECHLYLINKFQSNIDYVKNSKGGNR